MLAGLQGNAQEASKQVSSCKHVAGWSFMTACTHIAQQKSSHYRIDGENRGSGDPSSESTQCVDVTLELFLDFRRLTGLPLKSPTRPKAQCTTAQACAFQFHVPREAFLKRGYEPAMKQCLTESFKKGKASE